MAQQKGMLSQVLGQITELPGAHQAMEALNGLRDRLDDLQRRVRGFEDLEGRVQTLERKVAELSKEKKPAAGRKSATTRTAAAVKKSAPKSGSA